MASNEFGILMFAISHKAKTPTIDVNKEVETGLFFDHLVKVDTSSLLSNLGFLDPRYLSCRFWLISEECTKISNIVAYS